MKTRILTAPLMTQVTALILIVASAFLRLVPHPANVTPIIGMALFSGALFGRRPGAVLIPLFAMFLSDLVLGFHDQMIPVYGSIVVVAILSAMILKNTSVARVVCASLLGSVVFFLITNFTVWLSSGFYAPTLQGLIECYTLALPFFRSAVIGDLAYSGLIFGLWALASRALPTSYAKGAN